MRDFLLVFKILYKNANVKKVDASGKRKISQKIILFIVALPLLLIFGAIVGMTVWADVLNLKDLSALITAIVAMGQIFTLMFGLHNVISILYSGDDRALMNSLPIRPTSVFMAKFALSYVQLFKISSIIIIPLSLTAAITYAACGRAMFYAFFALFFVVALIAPLLPLAVITLFSLPISYIGSYLKGHSVLKSILSILIYVALFAAYIAVVFLINSSTETLDGGESASGVVSLGSSLSGIAAFGRAFYPTKVSVECALGINGWVNFGISAAITIGIIALTTLLAALFFKRITQRSLESAGDRSKSSAQVSFRQSGHIPALIKRDFMSLIRNSQMALSNFANMLLSPVFIVLIYFFTIKNMQSSAEAAEISAQVAGVIGMSLAFLFSSIYLGGANMLAMLAFSREGKAYYLNRSLPISAGTQVKAKLLLALAASGIINLIDFILVVALYGAGIVNGLMFFICSDMCIVGGVGLNVYADARFGNADWSTRQELQQSAGGINRLIVALASVAVPVVGMILGVILAGVARGLSMTMIYLIFWAVCAALSAAFMGLGLALSLKYAAKYLENFGERKRTVRSTRGGFRPPRGGLLR